MNGGLFQANYSISWSDKEPFPFSHWVLASPQCLPLHRERAWYHLWRQIVLVEHMLFGLLQAHFQCTWTSCISEVLPIDVFKMIPVHTDPHKGARKILKGVSTVLLFRSSKNHLLERSTKNHFFCEEHCNNHYKVSFVEWKVVFSWMDSKNN